MKLPASYKAADYETNIYRLWETSGVFQADPKSPKKHFYVVMPPPNETGTLHIGHAIGIALQDIVARHARSKGRDVLWLPGTDHAALATNAIIEEQLRKEGTDKHAIGREAFLKRTRKFVATSRGTMNAQTRAMGASVDWSRARYTLGPSLNRCVNEVFVKMYNDGLIYRGYRIVNWDPKLETNVSDDEVEYKEEKAKLYTLKYGPFEIATARPETKFGDKYVVMHPEDKRYKKYKHGDQLEVEWINGKLTATIIKDEAADPNFGTGVMTITPWHSQIDFEIAERHNLDREQIIDLRGRLLPIAAEFTGLNIADARDKIVDKLDKKGLLLKVDNNYVHNLAVNSRGKGIIEPQIRLQWFIDVNKPALRWKGNTLSFKQVLQAVIREGDVKIIPARYNKVYFHWIDNLRDWCISRQIWWGHQIPVWYQKDSSGKEQTHVGVLPPKDEAKWQQDPDTLDTWFSAALWTWSTLIDPTLAEDYNLSLEKLLKNSPDFLAYHPADFLDTAWDILFFWVARMILATTYITHQIPFKTVYLHGLVLNETGSKMSKSHPETIIDPMDVVAEYGTDALRLALIQGMSAGNHQKLVLSKVITNRNFSNKLWNVARYIDSLPTDSNQAIELKSIADHWILGELIATKELISQDLDHYRFSEAYNNLYHFLWDDLADWYIEASKVQANPRLLHYLLKHTLIMAHPLAPYVTEAIWQTLDLSQGGLLASEVYERLMEHDHLQAEQFNDLKLVISETRRIIQSLGQKQVSLSYKPADLLDKNRTLIIKLGGVSGVQATPKPLGLKLTGTSFDVSLDIDRSKAKAYLKKLEEKREDQVKHIDRLTKRLDSSGYRANAPEEVVAESKEQLNAYQTELINIDSEIHLFSEL